MTDNFMLNYEKERQERKAKAKQHLLSLCDSIGPEYRYLVAYFDGSGDSGQVERITLSNEDAALDARYDGDLSGDEDLKGMNFDEIAESASELTPDGFENGEGGFGAVIVDAHNKTVKVNYSYRVEDSVADDYEA